MHGARRNRDAVSWASHPHAPLCLWRAAAPAGASTRPTPRQRDPESTRPAPRQCRRRVDAALPRQRTACVDAPPLTLMHRAYVNAALPASTRPRVDAAGSALTQAARQRGPRALTQAPRQRAPPTLTQHAYVNTALPRQRRTRVNAALRASTSGPCVNAGPAASTREGRSLDEGDGGVVFCAAITPVCCKNTKSNSQLLRDITPVLRAYSHSTMLLCL